MFVWEADEINDIYSALVRTVLVAGSIEQQHNDTTDKALTTKELHPAIFELDYPLRRLVTAPGRNVNVPFALAEVLWILGGRNDVEMLQHYNSKIANYSDDGQTFNAAYGHRIRHHFGHDQLEDVARTLRDDPGSRQAVIATWSPRDDRGWTRHSSLDEPAYYEPHVAKDRACNVLSHFMIREGRLDLSQIVRSNDLMWGTPYNLVQWTHVQEFLAAMVGVPVGRYVHFADSLHIYDWHWDEAGDVVAAPPFNLYAELGWDHAPLDPGQEAWLPDVLKLEEQIRTTGVLDSYKCSLLPRYWQRILFVLRAHDFFKRKMDREAFVQLTMSDPDLVYMAATLRFWWVIRWHKVPEMRISIEMLDLPPLVVKWITQDTVRVG